MAELKTTGSGQQVYEVGRDEHGVTPIRATADVDFPGAVWIGCSEANFGYGRHGYRPFAICNHIMQGNLRGTDAYFLQPRPDKPSSAHFGIGHDSSGRLVVHQYVRVRDTAYANGIKLNPNYAAVPWLREPGNPNYRTISIEHEGYVVLSGRTVARAWYPSLEMYNLTLELQRYLTEHYDIEIDRAHVTRHSDYDSLNKWFCPNPGYPMAALLGDLGDPNFAWAAGSYAGPPR